MRKGKDIGIEYCSNLVTQDIDHLQSCLDNERDIKNGKYNGLSGCPSTFGMDNFDGLCFEEEIKGLSQQCRNCWKTALEMKIN
ncbi:hypothetical protein [Cytobacillus praedii]|uniref:hypothetical protein n=1 Tax=Cytobacillus praedii TaxID=1742358 RepID=UPI002E1C3225|nr:hypothetical protein [Cytobacillus praedii]